MCPHLHWLLHPPNSTHSPTTSTKSALTTSILLMPMAIPTFSIQTHCVCQSQFLLCLQCRQHKQLALESPPCFSTARLFLYAITGNHSRRDQEFAVLGPMATLKSTELAITQLPRMPQTWTKKKKPTQDDSALRHDIHTGRQCIPLAVRWQWLSLVTGGPTASPTQSGTSTVHLRLLCQKM